MFFEGSEKKAEIIVKSEGFSLLRDLNEDFWHELVQCCQARILSNIRNESCNAYLLSESSLFVWHDRFLILTCGVTTLVKAVEYFLNHVDTKMIKHVFYQRKNEYFAHAQLTSFGEDTQLLSQYLTGKAYRFGEMDSHHNYVFHLQNDYKANPGDKTYQLLAYQISEQASRILTFPGLSARDIRGYLNLESLLPGFEVDDFVFEPYGYSLNAIKGNQYLTIHITPQATSSYVSFDSNIDLIRLAPKILNVLQPTSFDLLSFNDLAFENKIKNKISDQYISKALVDQTLSNGYYICFATFIKPQTSYSKPVQLNLVDEKHGL